MMNERVKKVLARPEVLMMGPVVAPAVGDTFPIHLISRRIYSYPETLHVLGEELGAIVKTLGVSKVVGGETTGVILAVAISMAHGIPMCYVREDVPTPPRSAVEGMLEPGERVALVDDSYVAARHKLKFIENIERAGGVVQDIVVTCDVPMRGREEMRRAIAQRGIEVHSLCTVADWYQALYEAGHLSTAMLEVAQDAFTDPGPWQGDTPQAREKWAWFERVKQAQQGRFV